MHFSNTKCYSFTSTRSTVWTYRKYNIKRYALSDELFPTNLDDCLCLGCTVFFLYYFSQKLVASLRCLMAFKGRQSLSTVFFSTSISHGPFTISMISGVMCATCFYTSTLCRSLSSLVSISTLNAYQDFAIGPCFGLQTHYAMLSNPSSRFFRVSCYVKQ